jgi:hypothetical protein
MILYLLWQIFQITQKSIFTILNYVLKTFITFKIIFFIIIVIILMFLNKSKNDYWHETVLQNHLFDTDCCHLLLFYDLLIFHFFLHILLVHINIVITLLNIWNSQSRRGCDLFDLKPLVQSVPITSKVVSSNPVHGKVTPEV